MFLRRGRGRGVEGRGSWPCHGGGRTPHLASRRLARVVTAEFTGNGESLAASFTTPIRAVRDLLQRTKNNENILGFILPVRSASYKRSDFVFL